MRRHFFPLGAVTVLLLSVMSLAWAGSAWAGGADVTGVEVEETGDHIYRFTVTVRHADEGWDHYADAFVIGSVDGKELARRVLHHPHVNEQPFTRTLSDVEILARFSTVTVRAHDSVHGFDGRVMTVRLPD